MRLTRRGAVVLAFGGVLFVVALGALSGFVAVQIGGWLYN